MTAPLLPTTEAESLQAAPSLKAALPVVPSSAGVLLADDAPGAEFVGAEFVGRDLTGANLAEVNLAGADFTGAKLIGANLSGANLNGAILNGALLMGANLVGADLSGCTAVATVFGGADLTEATFVGADLSNAALTKAIAVNTDFRTATLVGARMVETDLGNADFTGADLRRSDMTGARVKKASFRDVDLRDARLRSLRGFDRADWVNCDIYGVDFTGAYLVRRSIIDQNYLEEFRSQSRRHNVTYWIWWATSDCGRSFLRWGVWTELLALVFAVLYGFVDIDAGANPTPLSLVYFSVVTMTTLGYGDVLPVSQGAQMLVIAQVVIGYVMLGGLLGIFATKMGRRGD